jgi:uncharacterized membrane protein YcaP (DUF421 family)
VIITKWKFVKKFLEKNPVVVIDAGMDFAPEGFD